MTSSFVIGADIGGSHITSMAVDLENKKLLRDLSSRRPVDCHETADCILEAWTGSLRDVISCTGMDNLAGIGFAMPGPFDYTAGVANFTGVKKYEQLNNVHVRDEIGRRLELPEDLPVRFLNDATCFAIGEAWMGPASRFRRTMAITLGTGFGSAFLDDGIPVEEGPDVPESGCVYHLPFGDSNADDHFSSRWFKHVYEERLGHSSGGVKDMSEEALLNPVVMEIFSEFGRNLGNFLAPWLVRFSTGCLTIGGNLSRGYGLFEHSFHLALQSHGCDTEIFLSQLGEYAAIAGSARLTDDAFYSRLPFISNK